MAEGSRGCRGMHEREISRSILIQETYVFRRKFPEKLKTFLYEAYGEEQKSVALHRKISMEGSKQTRRHILPGNWEEVFEEQTASLTGLIANDHVRRSCQARSREAVRQQARQERVEW